MESKDFRSCVRIFQLQSTINSNFHSNPLQKTIQGQRASVCKVRNGIKGGRGVECKGITGRAKAKVSRTGH